MRALAVFASVLFLASCAGGGGVHRGGRLSKQQYLSAIEVMPAPMRNGSSGAPIMGLVVSGTITNDGTAPLICNGSNFVLVRPGGNDIVPATHFCTTPTLPPQQSTYFNVTFLAAPNDDLQLRFEHGDGSYEIHDLAVPPG